MTEQRYVATDPNGIDYSEMPAVLWPLPTGSGAPGAELVAGERPLVLYTAAGLLKVLDERIFRAEATGTEPPAEGDAVEVGRARLVAETPWGLEPAASFALDCVEHVLGDAGDVSLPGGTTLAGAIADARATIARTADSGEHRLGFLARLGATRRLRRLGENVGDLAFDALVDDEQREIEGLDDPVWATLAALGEALLAALEAVRHHALPHYVAAREATVDEHDDSDPNPESVPIVTPWGVGVAGAEHVSPYQPAWVAARNAANRARAVARDRGGESAQEAERAWQAERLEERLS